MKEESLLTPEQAAEIISLKASTLAYYRWLWNNYKRLNKKVPSNLLHICLPYVKCGRAIRYRLKDVQKFAKQRTVIVK